ncbi:ABC transporter substrate-binding protein [Glutamicibacter arilaitensis]|uniref:ABC transporter substrate-binding protein n=1 Tax=Glutamicibacter arilaitensis TaxID=256701 RepID=UPI00384DFEFC
MTKPTRMRGLGRVLAFSSIAALTLSGLTACSGNSSAAGETSGPITYWASNQGSSISQDEKVLGESIKRFTAETGIEVELEVIPWGDLYNRILTAVSSGEGPDVLNIGNTWASTLQASGAFVPWEGEALEAVGGAERFVPAAFSTGGVEGQAPTSLPLYSMAYSLYYNTKMFDEAGISKAPTTWDEFVSDAKKLTKDTDSDGKVDQYGFALAGQRVSNNAHAAFILGMQNGGELYTSDGKPDFTNDGVVAGVNDWVQLMGEEGVVSKSNAEINDGSVLPGEMVSGNTAMFFDQAPGKSLKAADFKDYAVAPIPLKDGDATGIAATQSLVAGINVSVFENSDQKDSAIEFVGHLVSDDEQKKLNAAYTSIPSVSAAFEDAAFETQEMNIKKDILANNAAPMPLYPTEGQMESLVGEAIAKLFAQIAQGDEVSEEDVRKALENAQKQMPAS